MSKCEKTDSPINYFISFGWLYIRLLLLYSSVVEPCWLLVVHWATRVEHNRCLLHEAHTHTGKQTGSMQQQQQQQKRRGCTALWRHTHTGTVSLVTRSLPLIESFGRYKTKDTVGLARQTREQARLLTNTITSTREFRDSLRERRKRRRKESAPSSLLRSLSQCPSAVSPFIFIFVVLSFLFPSTNTLFISAWLINRPM